ncbi:TlpA family protein disulfide reductase [Herminiimonas aquatilis]|uniref:TlpA family protein disulfide reductase n=1 Tax=Herminiimonas aquatilis TaxID=345342 RepID=A0ABW2J7A8_9BURK
MKIQKPSATRMLFITVVCASILIGVYVGLRDYGETGADVTGASGSSVTIDIGGQRFVRWDEPRPLPALSFQDQDGKTVSLENFYGRVVLLNVWATWCPPCRKEMPSLDRLNAKRGGQDFEVVALSIDHDPSAVLPFYREIGIKTLRGYFDSNARASAALGAFAVPATLLIDKSGREIGRALGPAEWDSAAVETLIEQALSSPFNND